MNTILTAASIAVILGNTLLGIHIWHAVKRRAQSSFQLTAWDGIDCYWCTAITVAILFGINCLISLASYGIFKALP